MLLLHHTDHLVARDLESGARSNRRGRGQAQPGRRDQRLFSDKIPGAREA